MTRKDDYEYARHQAQMHGGEPEDYLDEKKKYKNGNGKWSYGSGEANTGNVIAEYLYQDEYRNPYLRVQRTDTKQFPQAHWEREQWRWGKPKGPKIPYCLPQLIEATPETPIFISEGEKDADTLTDLHLLATCASEGAGKWTPDLNRWFDGKQTVYILEDNDVAGRKHARQVAANLKGIVHEVRIVKLPDLPVQGDVTDWLETGNTKERLLELCAAAPLFVGRLDGVSVEEDQGMPPPEIAALNEKYALVKVGDKVVVMDTSDEIKFMAVSAFETWHRNRHVYRNEKKVSLGKFWMDHAQRRQYEGITFSPKGDVPEHYNLWRGFAVEPRPGDCSKFLAHIKANVCHGNEDHYQWVIGWFADIIQNPDKKSGTSLVLRGKQGTGKTIIGKAIGSLLGTHYFAVSDARLITGRFNAHLTACLLLHADEAFWAGDHAAEGKLKDLITGEFHFIEFKGKEIIKVRNFVRMLVSGNPDWLVPAGHEERRFATFDMAETNMQDKAYFTAIKYELDHGGCEALLHHLLNFNLKSVDLRTIPITAALLDQKLSSLTSEAGWWLDVLHRGELPWGCPEDGECPAAALFSQYIRHAQMKGVARRSIETQLGKFLTKHVLGLTKSDKAHNVPTRNGGSSPHRGSVYVFPSLTKCRATFAKAMQQELPWDDRAEWGKLPAPPYDEAAPF